MRSKGVLYVSAVGWARVDAAGLQDVVEDVQRRDGELRVALLEEALEHLRLLGFRAAVTFPKALELVDGLAAVGVA